MAAARTVYVYYKVPAAERVHWLAQVDAFCAAARERWPRLSVELSQRPEAGADGRETWMEVWHHPAGVDAAVAAALDELASARGLPFQRASEAFIPIRR